MNLPAADASSSPDHRPERRGFPRPRAWVTARCRPTARPADPAAWARLVDLCPAGVGVLSAVGFQAGDRLEIAMDSPGADEALVRVAEVRWVLREPGGWFRLGCCWEQRLTFPELQALV
jgi:hypothetical protein